MRDLKFILFSLAVALFGLSSCEDNNSTPEETGVKYTVSLRDQASAESTADYLLLTDDLMSGEITAVGKGTELTGWNYVAQYGETTFAIGYTDNYCVGYKQTEGTYSEIGKFAFESMDMLAPVNNQTFVGIGAPRGGGMFDCQLQVVDIEGVQISKKVKHTVYESYGDVLSTGKNEQLNVWPTYSYVEGDKLFVFFYPLHGASWETPNTDEAYASIYSYPELEFIKTIKDTRTSPVGYYAAQPCVVENENGDHYTFSSSSIAAGFTQATKPSGVLRIKAGEDKFDTDYFFNVEEKGYKVLTAAYAGNGKVVAKVIKNELDILKHLWGAFKVTVPLVNVAILDLEAKSFTLVDDVPAHGGQYRTPMLAENGKVYISVNDGAEAYVYQVDAENASATKGAKIIGNELQAIVLN